MKTAVLLAFLVFQVQAIAQTSFRENSANPVLTACQCQQIGKTSRWALTYLFKANPLAPPGSEIYRSEESCKKDLAVLIQANRCDSQ